MQLPTSVLETSLGKITEHNDTNPYYQTYRPYLAGLLSARLGEFPTALRYAAEVDSIALATKAPEEPHSLEIAVACSDRARTVRAEVAWLQGHWTSPGSIDTS